MGSFAGSADAAGFEFVENLMIVLGGVDGLVGAAFGSIGNFLGLN